jgi:hypothetical protein
MHALTFGLFVPSVRPMAGSLLCAWNDLETFSTPAFERALSAGASHLVERHTSKRSVRADIR